MQSSLLRSHLTNSRSLVTLRSTVESRENSPRRGGGRKRHEVSGHRASGIGHRASGIGHRTSGIGYRSFIRMATATLPTTDRVTDTFPINGTDYVEFWVGNARQASLYYRAAF